MKNSILVALNESMISRAVIDYLIKICLDPENQKITLLHIFRQPSSAEMLMGKKFAAEQQPRMTALLEDAKQKLVEHGFKEDQISLDIITESYTTVSEGIIDQFSKKKYDMVLIGRKRMSKSEEFVLGDIAIKLVRALEGTGILVVKTD